MKRAPFALAALGAGLAGLALAAAAVPLDFHPADPLPYLRLFPHDGDVVVTWQNGISHIDSEILEITDLDTARFFLLPTPVPGSEQFFYFRLDTWPDTLRVVRGREIETMADQIDVGTFAAAGGNLFFTTWRPGLDVWASDGTMAGTGELSDIVPDWNVPCSTICPPGFHFPRQLTASASGRLYYVVLQAGTSSYQYELWTRDPAVELPGLPPVPQPESRRLAVMGDQPLLTFQMADGRLFYFLDEPGHSGSSLWRSDGSLAGTVRLAAFGGLEFSFSENLVEGPVELGGDLFFMAYRAARRELWRSDGTAEGTVLVRDLGAGPRAAALWSNGLRLYFPLDAEGRGEELWSSDGSAEGTRLVADIGPGLASAKPRAFAPLPGGRFLISLDDGVHGQEPWLSDGTAEGTTLVADALPGAAGSDPADFAPAGDRLFFIGSNGAGRRTPSYVELALPEVCPDDRLCLQNGRFRVETFFSTGADSGQGKRAVASDEAGIFSFFSPDNWEVMVKVLDGCALNGHFWVFGAAATDVQYELRVTDLETEQVSSYSFAGGSPAPATTDIEAFATCEAFSWRNLR